MKIVRLFQKMPNDDLKIDALDLESPDSSDEVEVDELDALMNEADKNDLTVPAFQLFSTSPVVILAAASVIKPEATVMNITATVGGGAVTLTSNPSIADGVNGQFLILRGSHATDTITLTDGNGMKLSANVTLALNDTITLYFDGIVTNDWIELARSTNG